MDNVTFIIPLHVFDETVEKFLTRALESLAALEGCNACKLMFVGPSEVINKAEVLAKKVGVPQSITLIVNDKTDFETQVNKAAYQCLTKYFSVLEFDDYLYPYWGKVAERYTYKNISVFLPIVELCDEEGNVLSFANELAWSTAFCDELGFIDLEALKTYMDFHVTGGLIKTEDFIAFGGLKPSLKMASWYEFLLRFASNYKQIFVLPRVGYKHTVGRDNSNMVISRKTISQEEGSWLIKRALNEYTQKEDTNEVFTPSDTE